MLSCWLSLNKLAWRWLRLMLPEAHCLRVGREWNMNARGWALPLTCLREKMLIS
jgi:hypothetical protein